MTTMRWRALVALLLMVAAFGAAQAWRPTYKLADSRPKVELDTIFPKQFGEWQLDERMPVQLVSPDTQAVLDKIYSQTLSRTYVNRGGDRIMLSVAYGGDQSDATRAHRPEVCYPAQGFQINSSGDGVVQTPGHPMRVRHLVAKAGARNEPITYWIVVGDRVTLSGTEQKLAQLSYSTRGLIADGMLVRVSTIDGDADNAFRVQARFIAELAAAVPEQFRSQVIGTSGRLTS